MARYDVPTHLETEDTLLFGLTVRQVLLIALGATIGYNVWQTLQHQHASPVLALVPALLCPVIAFLVTTLAPAGRPLEQWLFIIARYLAMPRYAVWRPVAEDEEDAGERLVRTRNRLPLFSQTKEDAA
jgi:PrgI family protein